MGGDKKWKVLYFDDNALALQATTFAFAETEMELSTASNFEELQSRLDEGSYDLVLLDVEVPEVFGDDVGSVLKGSRGLETPIYLYSSLPPEELEERAKDAGLDGFICKDVGMEGLMSAVRARLNAKS
jgi:DNA-binding response OmpR family regulator